MKRRPSQRWLHLSLMFASLCMAIVSMQFLVYVLEQAIQVQRRADVHVFVKAAPQREAPGSWADSLPADQWEFLSLGEWADRYQSIWESSEVSAVSPVELFEGTVQGVWVGKAAGRGWWSAVLGVKSMGASGPLAQDGVMAVVGFPQWANEFRSWFWTWVLLSLGLLGVSTLILVNAVAADIRQGMLMRREDIEIRSWLGATRSQIRRPLLQNVVKRVLVVFAVGFVFNATGIATGVWMNAWKPSLDWMTAAALALVAAGAGGIIVAWLASRVSFAQLFREWTAGG